MKSHLDIHHEGTLGTEGRVKMSFDEDSVTHLMSVLTDLYSDPALAVIREYSTNAYDAHRAAGNTAPIKVGLPNGMNPIFVVKDEGVGMSVDDVCNHFSKYGWSSKRDTNNEVGMLGLGCKSGLTYASQFTFVAIHNGVKATVLVTRDDDGAGAIQVVDTVSTDERNGVEVRVPVKEVLGFCQKARHFFSFWEKGSVLLDDEEPVSIFDHPEALVLEKDLVILKNTILHKDFIVMGNVPYPLERTHDLVHVPGMNAVVRVPIGTVNFTPSREALHYTNRTKQVITDVADKIKNLIFKMAQAELDACKTHAEAIQCAARWRPAVMGRQDLLFRGQPIPSYFNVEVIKSPNTEDARIHKAFWWYTRHSVDEPAQRCLSIEANFAYDHLYVVGHRGSGVLSSIKLRLKQYLAENGLEDRRAVFVHEMPGGEWLADAERVDYNVLCKSSDNPPRKRKETVRVISPHGNSIDTQRDALTTPLVYLKVIERTTHELAQRVGRIMDKVGGTCVLLNENQVAKFTREYPHAVAFKDWLQLHAKGFLACLKPEEAYYMAKCEEPIRAFFIEPELVFDPEFRSVVERIKKLDWRLKDHEWRELLRLCREMGVDNIKSPNEHLFAAEVDTLYKRYPLLHGSSYMRHLGRKEAYLDYINGVYLLRQQNNA